jgi:hypothetical protein
LERRLGKAPSPTDVKKAAEALAGTKGLTFVRHAVRVQEQLANLHAQLQRDLEPDATDAVQVQDSSPPSMESKKRSVGHDDESSDPPRETKRIRVESEGAHRHMPSSNTPESDNNGVKPASPPAPGPSTVPKDVPIAPRAMRSDARFAEVPRAESAKAPTTVDNPPSRLPVIHAVPPTPSNDNKSDSSRQVGPQSPPDDAVEGHEHHGSHPAPRDSVSVQAHIQNKLGKAPSLSISTSISEAQVPSLTT